MKKYAAAAATVAMVAQATAPAQAAGLLKDTTMLGWQQTSRPAAVAYFKMPLQGDRGYSAQPRAGLMISQPRSYAVGAAPVHQAGVGALDFGFTGRSFNSPWTASLMVSNQVAWASNPDALPKNKLNMFDSGVSWVVVGLLSAGIAAGVYVAADSD